MVRLTLANVWGKSIYPSLGLGYVASYLQKYGFFSDISIVECGQNIALEKIRATNPDIVGFGSTTPGFFGNVSVAKELKKELDVFTVIGGTHITSLPQTLPRAFDFGILGEGEQTFMELLQAIEAGKQGSAHLKKINGLAFHDGKKVKISKPRALIEPLDKIPFPARKLFDMEYYLKKRDVLCTHELLRGTSLMTSRGCPYKCVFCQASRHWNRIRINSAEYVVEEIALLKEKYGVEALAIVDDLFIANKKRVEEIAKGLSERGLAGEIKFMVDGRANLMDNAMLATLKKMGVVSVAIGFESGSERMLQYLKKNSVTLKQNLECVESIKKFGMGIYGQFMFGAPGEKREDILATKKLMENPAITTAHVSVTTPLPGTELWDYCIKEKLVDQNNIDWRNFDMDPTTRKEGEKYAAYINKSMPFEEFFKLYNECREVSLMKEARGKSFFTLQNLLRSLRKPLLSIHIALRLLQQKIGKKNEAKK